ncbi:unnamed protein product [Caenorhabditis angaria]|uniref:Alpha-1,3/1,6-mannosyltransferase ALG2 n=1 Tax=Caenorhabditis angaria TaxID=860376 RepID=A0A9P1MX13_9PELO|nr:unnamed protein product [Caenorhabditis angaria]
MKITILHPDLGIGGAERLIVDAAVALKQKGHHVRIVTNHYDPNHAFSETRDLEITTCFSWIPRSIFGRFFALFAYLKMMLAAFFIVFGSHNDSDFILSDTVSASQFILRKFGKRNLKLAFYCHFPDMLLTKRETKLKRVYRSLIDGFEEYTTSLADVIFVNSEFTAGVVRETFKTLQNRQLHVLYPSLNTKFFDSIGSLEKSEIGIPTENSEIIFTSLNRFERKKCVEMALNAFDELRNHCSYEEFDKCHLVIAGGYDKKNQENIDYFEELRTISEYKGLENDLRVTFLKSPSDDVKVNLIRQSYATLYTPDREHFGIVPVESMYLGTPVIAVNTGGPCESIADGKTGFLVAQTKEEFAAKMLKLIREPQLRQENVGKCSTTRSTNLLIRGFSTKIARHFGEKYVIKHD